MFVLLMLHGSLYGQDLQVSLFDDVKKSMQVAKDAQSDLLSPRAFGEAMNEYSAARKEYDEKGDISDIMEKIRTANIKFQKATENTKVSAVMFSSSLSARGDAIDAEAEQYVKEIWNKAEEAMKDASGKLERGDANKAEKMAMEATKLYRKSELESIKANYLSNARKLLQKADDNKVYRVAPKTIAEAKNLVRKAEKELLENRYDTDGARHLAQQAEYKAMLAMYIAKEEKILSNKDFETEDYLLMSFEPLTKIGESLNINVKFDKGVGDPVSEILNRITDDKLLITNLESDLQSQQMTNENLEALLDEQQKILENTKGTLTEEALKAQSRIDRMGDINAKFERVQQIFDQEQAQVFRQKDDVIIRMIGVNFDVGKSQIKQENYALLTKLQKAMKQFSNASIAIEGHTDSQGSDDLNLKLSQERADAVLSYLTANTSIDSARFSTIGFGESRPVANNETSAGRKLNRRIDIVIKPNFQ